MFPFRLGYLAAAIINAVPPASEYPVLYRTTLSDASDGSISMGPDTSTHSESFEAFGDELLYITSTVNLGSPNQFPCAVLKYTKKAEFVWARFLVTDSNFGGPWAGCATASGGALLALDIAATTPHATLYEMASGDGSKVQEVSLTTSTPTSGTKIITGAKLCKTGSGARPYVFTAKMNHNEASTTKVAAAFIALTSALTPAAASKYVFTDGTAGSRTDVTVGGTVVDSTDVTWLFCVRSAVAAYPKPTLHILRVDIDGIILSDTSFEAVAGDVFIGRRNSDLSLGLAGKVLTTYQLRQASRSGSHDLVVGQLASDGSYDWLRLIEGVLVAETGEYESYDKFHALALSDGSVVVLTETYRYVDAEPAYSLVSMELYKIDSAGNLLDSTRYVMPETYTVRLRNALVSTVDGVETIIAALDIEPYVDPVYSVNMNINIDLSLASNLAPYFVESAALGTFTVRALDPAATSLQRRECLGEISSATTTLAVPAATPGGQFTVAPIEY